MVDSRIALQRRPSGVGISGKGSLQFDRGGLEEGDKAETCENESRGWMANLMAEVRIEEKNSSENLSSETSGHLGNSGDLTPGKPGQPGQLGQCLQPGQPCQPGQQRLAVQGPSPDGSLLSLPGDPTENDS